MKKISIAWLLCVQWALAFEWLHSSFPKWTDSKFMDNIGKTLYAFAQTSSYAFYGQFLTAVAIPRAELFGQIIRSSELAVGVALALSGLILISKKTLHPVANALTVAACFGAALMNLNFFAASGGTSPSAWGLNLLMAIIEIMLGIFYIQNRHQLAEKIN